MTRWLPFLIVLGLAGRDAPAGVGIAWTTTAMGAYDSDATDLTGGDNALLDRTGVIWQLIYAGPDGAADPPNLSNGARGWVSGDDVVWAVREIPMGGGGADDGTVWDHWMTHQSGIPNYVDLGWDEVGHVYQRVYQGNPVAEGWYFESGLVTLNTNYSGGMGLPQVFMIGTAFAGFQPDRRLPGSSLWDDGYQDIGGGWRRLSWFGDYAVMPLDGWIWHNRHGFFYVANSSGPTDTWLFAMDMGWLYTGQTLYPFLYRADDGAWLWFNGATDPRWFMNFFSGQWEGWP
jgi:hypothetical protein